MPLQSSSGVPEPGRTATLSTRPLATTMWYRSPGTLRIIIAIAYFCLT